MLAMLSSTALMESFESAASLGEGNSGSFAELKFVSRRLDLGSVDDAARVCESTQPICGSAASSRCTCGTPSKGIAEGAVWTHDVGNLLRALSPYFDLLAIAWGSPRGSGPGCTVRWMHRDCERSGRRNPGNGRVAIGRADRDRSRREHQTDYARRRRVDRLLSFVDDRIDNQQSSEERA